MKIRMPERPKLSIGMIVKNEQKHIRNCLEALKPLMEQVQCELIIADTGSIDETLEIAKEYTDQAFSFEWIDDFSAARNATLDKATGEWYMFLDADEYLQDIREMVHFFNGKEQKKYNTATFIIRSFQDPSGQNYSDFRGIRCTKMSNGARFHNKIHEYLPVIPPIKHLETIADHYGYVFETAEEAQRKQKRNMDLMEEEQKQTPDSTRLMALIYDSARGEKQKEALEHGLELVRKDKRDVYYMSLYQRAMEYYTRTQDFIKVEEIGKEYFEEKLLKECATDIDMYAMYGTALRCLDRQEEAIQAYERYLELYQKYQDGTLYTDDMIYTMVTFTHPSKYLWLLQELANLYSDFKQYEKAADTALRIDYQELSLQHFQSLLMTMSKIMEQIGDPGRFKIIYSKTRELQDQEKTNCLLQIIEQYYYSHEQDQITLALALTEVEEPWQNDSYIQLMKLIVIQGQPEFLDELNVLIANEQDWGVGFTEGLYLAIRYNQSILSLVKRLHCDELDDLMGRLAGYRKNIITDLILNYTIGKELVQSMKGAYIYTSLLSRAAAFADELNHRQCIRIYTCFTKQIVDYVARLYQSDMLEGNDIEVLPPLHRFGVCMYQAYQSKDDITFVKRLREALKQCPEMKQIISVLLKDFSDKQNNVEKEKTLFHEYTTKVRNKIIQISKLGMADEAQKLAKEYLKVIPTDKEIEDILIKKFEVEHNGTLCS